MAVKVAAAAVKIAEGTTQAEGVTVLIEVTEWLVVAKVVVVVRGCGIGGRGHRRGNGNRDCGRASQGLGAIMTAAALQVVGFVNVLNVQSKNHLETFKSQVQTYKFPKHEICTFPINQGP